MSALAKLITVPFLALSPNKELSLDTISDAFCRQGVEYHAIEQVNWEEFSYAPSVEFAIAHSGDMIFILYNVEESSIRALYTHDNQCKPFEDSCVEFFVSIDNSGVNYYNIESNCIGALQIKGGTDDFKNRVRYDDSVSSKILRFTSLPQGKAIPAQEGDFKWSLALAIPIEVLGITDGTSLSGVHATANFYKCGDMLPQPHYLSWNAIDTLSPSFHQPKYFGKIYFE